MGARPLRRAVEKHLEDTLAEAILTEEIQNSEKSLLVAKIKNKEVYFDSTSDTNSTDKEETAKTNKK
jgi:ATP-dependent Clp protease ATP-binding subunit ClpA